MTQVHSRLLDPRRPRPFYPLVAQSNLQYSMYTIIFPKKNLFIDASVFALREALRLPRRPSASLADELIVGCAEHNPNLI